MAPIVVLGIGNLLLQDEGVGVRVVEAIQRAGVPPEVELIDGGTSGADLVEFLADRRKVVVVDALDAGTPPGTILRLSPQDLVPDDGDCLSLHQLGLLESLAITRHLGCEPKEVVVFGIQPAVIRPGLELTPPVAAAVPRAVAAVRREIEGVRPSPLKAGGTPAPRSS